MPIRRKTAARITSHPILRPIFERAVALRWSMEDFAERSGYSRSFLYRLRNGSGAYAPRLQTLRDLAQTVGYALADDGTLSLREKPPRLPPRVAEPETTIQRRTL